MLRGDGGTRMMLVRPGQTRVLFMEPAEISQLPKRVEKSGAASVSVDSLTGKRKRLWWITGSPPSPTAYLDGGNGGRRAKRLTSDNPFHQRISVLASAVESS